MAGRVVRVLENDDGTWPFDETWIPRPGEVVLTKVIGGGIHKHLAVESFCDPEKDDLPTTRVRCLTRRDCAR